MVTVDDALGRQVFLPNCSSLVIAGKPLGLATLEHCCIHTFRIKFYNLCQILPRPVDGVLLEIVAKRPVTEHLKHCVMICVMTNLLKVVMLTAYAKTLLRVGNSLALRRSIAKNDILELVHTCIGEHKCRVVLDNHWG